MKKAGLIITYIAFIVLFINLAFSGEGAVQSLKYLLVLALAALLFAVTTVRPARSDMRDFNFLFFGTAVVFTLYASLFKASLYFNILFELFVAACIGFLLSILYREPRRKMKILPPRKPDMEPRVVLEEQVISTPVVESTKTKKVVRKVAKKAPKRAKKKVVKKTTKKKVAKKKVAPKKTTKRATKKSASRSIKADRNLISFNEIHEVNYLLRKFNRRITAANRLVLEKEGAKFKSLKSYAPHNRQSFYKYMKDKKLLAKLQR